MELSGTSFSAPIVSGIAALILGRHPEYTADQVKGALMLGAKPMPAASNLSVGVGEAYARRSVEILNPPNPNRALNAFIVTSPLTNARVFDAASWAAKAKCRRLLGGRLLGRRLLGRRLLGRRELGGRLLERRQLGLGLVGRHLPRGGLLGRSEPGQRIVGGQRRRRAERLPTGAQSMTSSSRPSSPARWIPRHMQHAGSPVRGNRSSVPRTGDAPSPGRFYVPRWATRLRPAVRSLAKEYLRWKHLTRA